MGQCLCRDLPTQSGPRLARDLLVQPGWQSAYQGAWHIRANPAQRLGPQEGRAEVATYDFLPMLSSAQGENHKGPKFGQDSYITPAFSGVPNAHQGDKIKKGPNLAKMAT